MLKSKTVWIVWNNTDGTEGRGIQYPLHVCETEAVAKRLSKGKYVMGSDCPITEFESPLISHTYLAPYFLQRPNKEDIKRQEKIDKENEHKNKVKALIDKMTEKGFSDEEIHLLTRSKDQ